MTILEDIDLEVQRRAAQQHGAVLFGVFMQLKREHLRGDVQDCHCDYCRFLHQYVMLKRYRHRVLRRAEREDSETMYPDNDFARRLFADAENLLVVIRAARLKKNLAREIL